MNGDGSVCGLRFRGEIGQKHRGHGGSAGNLDPDATSSGLTTDHLERKSFVSSCILPILKRERRRGEQRWMRSE